MRSSSAALRCASSCVARPFTRSLLIRTWYFCTSCVRACIEYSAHTQSPFSREISGTRQRIAPKSC